MQCIRKDFADWRVWWIKKKADHYFPSPRRRLESDSQRSLDRKLRRDMRKLSAWFFLKLADRDLVMSHRHRDRWTAR
jgi:hypothetical protein